MAAADILGRSELFGRLKREHLEHLSGLCRPFSCSPGEVVFREGEAATRLYVLDDGRVALDIDILVAPDRPTIPTAVDMVGPADCFGWSSFIKPGTYRATARCLNPSSGVVIDADALRKAMREDATLGYEVMSRLAQTVADYLGHIRLRLTTQVTRLLDRTDW
ncbi:MAG: cyclic nucleotide-binding domain-containing protein [Gemmatimonadetes bacterium]|nr:cyclic nucleotide-binding domain-containing protein [Gemmatimonadota bacterium]